MLHFMLLELAREAQVRLNRAEGATPERLDRQQLSLTQWWASITPPLL